ncbi:MAG: XdhC family protein [Chloroflexi bacterium]|nr:XdhC family protein [Chloroflexota bacterium]
MEQVFRDAVSQLKDDRPVVLATVVRTSGSTPQKPGAKLLVREDGSGVGTLGGGCVEGDIWFAARMLMKGTGGAQMRDYELNEDLAAEDGLICGGTMYFLIDPIRDTDDLLPFAEEIVSAYDGGVPVAIASVVNAPEGSDVTIGSKLLVRENGTTESTLGSSELDEDATLRARKLMAMGKQEYVTHPSGVEYFVEAYTTPPRLILAGGGHVSKAIAPVAATVGFKITVIDDRPEFANEERFPEADAVYTEDFVTALNRLPINANTFIVIATRGHRYDDTALEAAAQSKASYVALLGSKRKTILIYEALLERGLPMERIRELRAPSGLDIQARTPEEIAVSIVAEMLMFRLGGDGRPMKLEERHLQRIQSKSAVTAAAD